MQLSPSYYYPARAHPVGRRQLHQSGFPDDLHPEGLVRMAEESRERLLLLYDPQYGFAPYVPPYVRLVEMVLRRAVQQEERVPVYRKLRHPPVYLILAQLPVSEERRRRGIAESHGVEPAFELDPPLLEPGRGC